MKFSRSREEIRAAIQYLKRLKGDSLRKREPGEKTPIFSYNLICDQIAKLEEQLRLPEEGGEAVSGK